MSHRKDIPYRPDLIKGLHEDHKKLLSLHGQMKSALNAQQVLEFQESLTDFKRLLVQHLLTEAVSLYGYLRQQLKEDEQNHELIKQYKREMEAIGKKVFDFADTYAGGSNAISYGMIEELDQIGQLLLNRLHREENELYLLYRRYGD